MTPTPRPWHDPIHLFQEPLPPRLLAVSLEARLRSQSLLPHPRSPLLPHYPHTMPLGEFFRGSLVSPFKRTLQRRSLCHELCRAGFGELLQVLELPANAGQLGKVRNAQKAPIGLT